jgi:AAA15 family ATPase/GTPase
MLLDEIDSVIHPSLLGNLTEVLKNIGEKTQLFITTHNPYFIDNFSTDNIYWIKDSFSSVENKINYKNIYSYKEILSLIKDKDSKKIMQSKSVSDLFVGGFINKAFPYDV